MRKILSAFFIAALLLSTQAYAGASTGKTATKPGDSSFAYLADWVGKWPTSAPADKEHNLPLHGNLWDDRRVMAALERTMGKHRVHQMITGWGGGGIVFPGIGIERIRDDHIGDFIAFFACKPHDCGGHGAYVFINLADGAVQACWVEESQASKARQGNYESAETWLSPLGERKLAEGDCSGGDLSLARIIQLHGDQTIMKDKKVN